MPQELAEFTSELFDFLSAASWYELLKIRRLNIMPCISTDN